MTLSRHRASTWLDREGGQILPSRTGGYEKKAGDGPLPRTCMTEANNVQQLRGRGDWPQGFLRLGAPCLLLSVLVERPGRRARPRGRRRLTPDEALAALKSGNERYVSHPELCSIDLAAQRNAVAAHQAPWATIISCADSRVPPELIFGGHGVGELFVARTPATSSTLRRSARSNTGGGTRLAVDRRPCAHKLRRR